MRIRAKIVWALLGMSLLVALVGGFAVNRQRAAVSLGAEKDAEDVARVPQDDKGRSVHCHVRINGGSVMISDFYPEHGHPPVAAQGFTMMLPVRLNCLTFEAGEHFWTPPKAVIM